MLTGNNYFVQFPKAQQLVYNPKNNKREKHYTVLHTHVYRIATNKRKHIQLYMQTRYANETQQDVRLNPAIRAHPQPRHWLSSARDHLPDVLSSQMLEVAVIISNAVQPLSRLLAHLDVLHLTREGNSVDNAFDPLLEERVGMLVGCRHTLQFLFAVAHHVARQCS